jgi:YesN/AraC family two-component response regulator
VITDIVMPGKEGLETISDLVREYPSVKIIAMSDGGAKQNNLYLRMAQGLGVATTLRKPFTAKDLLDTVQQVLSR